MQGSSELEEAQGGYHPLSALGQYLHRCWLDFEDLTLEVHWNASTTAQAFVHMIAEARPARYQDYGCAFVNCALKRWQLVFI